MTKVSDNVCQETSLRKKEKEISKKHAENLYSANAEVGAVHIVVMMELLKPKKTNKEYLIGVITLTY